VLSFLFFGLLFHGRFVQVVPGKIASLNPSMVSVPLRASPRPPELRSAPRQAKFRITRVEVFLLDSVQSECRLFPPRCNSQEMCHRNRERH
jgi:hypothetical protein